MTLRGSMTALITPFKGGAVDWQAFEGLIEYQIENGTHALVPCGTTGESPTLSHDEHKRIVEFCIERVKSRIPVIAGTGSNNTAEAIDFTEHAKQAGADAAMIVIPYYNKPTQEGLYQHYSMITETVDIPILIYNIPGRSVIQMDIGTMAKLAEAPNIIGVKDATNDLGNVKRIREEIGPDFIQLSGEDANIHDYLTAGGHGCISVTANVAPQLCSRLHQAWIDGDDNSARAIQKKLMPLHEALFFETSPQPVKYALSRLGLCREDIRLPLVPASVAAREAVDKALEQVGLINDSPPAQTVAHG